MSMVNRTVVLTLVIATGVLAAVPAAGQAPDVSFAAGRVTIAAHETPLAAILGAWDRHGGSQFVGAGRLPDQPVSVQLVDVPEREALRVLLRSAAGYVALPKAASQPGVSAYDRVVIMAAPAAAAARRPPAAGPESAAGAGGRLRPADPSGGASAAMDLDELDESEDPGEEDFDDLDELELVESLRRRYQAATAVEREDAVGPSFRTQPDGSPLGTAPRPGMVIAAEEPRAGPNPVRRRNRAR
ncbi:MAG: hypothetical protein F4Y57_11245 [Acidobacteria bacterium]|nr:hypothetical protein [Acidobacteriota bacterium]